MMVIRIFQASITCVTDLCAGADSESSRSSHILIYTYIMYCTRRKSERYGVSIQNTVVRPATEKRAFIPFKRMDGDPHISCDAYR